MGVQELGSIGEEGTVVLAFGWVQNEPGGLDFARRRLSQDRFDPTIYCDNVRLDIPGMSLTPFPLK